MTASQDLWVCPVCEHRSLYLSEFVDHVETRHPADNVTVLEVGGRTTGHEEEAPGPAADLPTALGFEPFDGFPAAARAVVEELSRGADREMSTLLVRLLGTVLAAEARTEGAAGGTEDSAERGATEPSGAGTDPGDRRTWMDVLATEEDRCRRHGMGASVVVVQLEEHMMVRFGGQEEDAVARVASAVSRQTRAHDKVVRLRPGTLGVLAVHCSEADARDLAERVLEALRAERVPVRTAVGSRGDRLDLYGAWEEAERRLEGAPPPGSASG